MFVQLYASIQAQSHFFNLTLKANQVSILSTIGPLVLIFFIFSLFLWRLSYQQFLKTLYPGIYTDEMHLSIHLVHVEWESRAIFLTIYDDLYKTYLWGIYITLNLFVALTSA